MKITEFGDPVLRSDARLLSVEEILQTETQQLIADMQNLLVTKELGVGLAAPQVGQGISLSVISIRSSQRRPKAKEFNLVIINPKITQVYGYRKQMYEGCISGGPGKAGLFARVPRYRKLDLEYYDENGELQTGTFDGLPAHVIQHEVDHLNGILFVDKVKDTKSYVTHKEYLKLVKKATSGTSHKEKPQKNN